MKFGAVSWGSLAKAGVYFAIVSVLAVFYQGCGGSFKPIGPIAATNAAGKSGESSTDEPISYAMIVQDASTGLTMPPAAPLEAGAPYLITLIAAELSDERINWSLINGSGCGMFAYGDGGRAQQIICSQGGEVTVVADIIRKSGSVDRVTVALPFGF